MQNPDDTKPVNMSAQLYKIANRLKDRMGIRFKDQSEGFLAPESIEEADKLVTALCSISPELIGEQLAILSSLWESMKPMPASPARTDLAGKIFTVSHEIKDMGSMCGHDLIAHFAESLRDYIARTDLHVTAQLVIVQAHIDAMGIVHRQGMKTGPQAEELKAMVKAAIDKYN